MKSLKGLARFALAPGWILSAALVALGGDALAQQGPVQNGDATPPADPIRMRPPFVLIDTGVTTSTVYATGAKIPLPTFQVWKPACFNRAPLTQADLRAMAAAHAAAFADPRAVTIVSGGQKRAGLNVVYQVSGTIPSLSLAAMEAAALYIESKYPLDNITMTIQVSFAALPPGVIGSTTSVQAFIPYTDSRAGLISGMDATDKIQAFLPSGTTIPVRYSLLTTTNEDRIVWNSANWKATGGTGPVVDAGMQFSTAFPFDWDPSNGVAAGTMSFQDVVVHETGHAMGFTSGVGVYVEDMTAMDIFRFRTTDGGEDLNPDTNAEFSACPRWAVLDNPNDDVHFEVILPPGVPMSDGAPWQSSHWQERTPALAIMDPTLDFGETFFPSFLRFWDTFALDAIGWDDKPPTGGGIDIRNIGVRVHAVPDPN